MKYSFMSFSTPTLGWTEMVDVARRYGYDGIETRLDSRHAHGIEVSLSKPQRDAIRSRMPESGIAISCLATSLTFADPSTAEAMVQQAHERIDLAGDVGASALRVFGGKLAEGLDREGAVELVAGSLRRVADHAAERKVTLCVETHDDWCDPAYMAAVMRRVDHPAVGVNWDIMHPVRVGAATMAEAFATLRDWIRHVHIHDGTGSGITFIPIGTGCIDHRKAIECLDSIRYRGHLSGEWINWEPYDIHLPRELATMKHYEELVALGRNGPAAY